MIEPGGPVSDSALVRLDAGAVVETAAKQMLESTPSFTAGARVQTSS
jgi:hypothetical protein